MEKYEDYKYTFIEEDEEGNLVDIFESDNLIEIHWRLQNIPEDKRVNAYVVDNEINKFILPEEFEKLVAEEPQDGYYDDELSEAFIDIAHEDEEYDELKDPNSIAYYYNEHPEDLYVDVLDGITDISHGAMQEESLEVILEKTTLTDEQKDELRAEVEF